MKGRDWSKFVKVGLPMLVFMVGGSYGLSKVVVGRFDARERDQQIVEQYMTQQDEGSKPRKPFNLQEELEKMKEELENSDYNIVYIERPKDRD